MQIASLIGNDRFMSRHNVSVSADDFIELMNDFPSVFRHSSKLSNPYALNMESNWSMQHEANWTKVLYKTGFCYTFNYPNASQMFHVEK
jgi:hypothetical protein